LPFFRRFFILLLGFGLLLALPSSSTQAVSPFDPVPLEPLPDGAVIQTIVPANQGNNIVAMDFTPDGRLLYTEKISGYGAQGFTAYVRVVVNGVLQPAPVIEFPVEVDGERGLLGLAVDPNFNANHYVWVYLTSSASTPAPAHACGLYENRVVRFVLDSNNLGSNAKVMGCFPVAQYTTIHNGGNLHFGPDGKLYVTVGNNNETNNSSDPSQNLGSPLGKLHRFNPTDPLSSPTDNPFYNMPSAVKSIYAFGLRNSFDFTFDPIGGKIFATENGEACDDEINRLLAGGDYGWRPSYPCDDETGPNPTYNTIPPLIYWTPSLAPTGITIYNGDLFPEWKGDLFMCSFKDSTTALHHFKLNPARTAITAHTIISGTHCRTDVLGGPDGTLYYSQEGGTLDGPLLRINRTPPFAASSVTVEPQRAQSGDFLTYTLQVRHTGTLSNTFALTATLSPSTTLQPGSFDYANGTLTYDANHIWWTGTMLQITTVLTTPFVVSSSIDLSASDIVPLHFRPTVIVNGYSVFLPIVFRNS
jgi:glucose/arabinose dehydrogenase